MRTEFSLAQLADPRISEANDIFRNCVHCGFCTATCPTFVLMGDERDSPRGRIYLLKDMLEKDKPADIVFFDGDPLDPVTRVTRVMIDGRIAYQREDQNR